MTFLFKRIKGFSLTEVIITVGLFTLMTTVGLGAYFSYYTVSLANADVNNAINALNEARFRALKNGSGADYGVYLDTNTQELITFKGTYVANDPGNIRRKLDYLLIGNLNLQPTVGNTRQVIFKNLTGKTVNSGSFTLSKSNFTYTVTVNSQGIVN